MKRKTRGEPRIADRVLWARLKGFHGQRKGFLKCPWDGATQPALTDDLEKAQPLTEEEADEETNKLLSCAEMQVLKLL